MEDRRWDRRDRYRRSQHRKPPRGSGFWKPSVPQWEKDFCREVGRINWKTIVDSKQWNHLYSNVMDWDDSAALEAFTNARQRYWASINGQPCDIPSPDPDLYIHNIDWDAKNEMLDIDNLTIKSEKEHNHEPVVIFGDALLQNQWVPPSGWGIKEELVEVQANTNFGNAPDQNQPIIPTGWGDEENIEGHGNPPARHQPIIPTGWADEENIEGNPPAQHQPIVPTGWGDEENIEGDGNPPAQYHPIAPMGWGDEENQPIAPMGFGDDEHHVELQYPQNTPTGWGENEWPAVFPTPYNPPAYFHSPWVQNWRNAHDNVPMPMWPGYYHNGGPYGGGVPPTAYIPWGGNWNAPGVSSYGHYPSHGWQGREAWRSSGPWYDSISAGGRGGRGQINFGSPMGRGRGFGQPHHS